jgi:hypothetical protein
VVSANRPPETKTSAGFLFYHSLHRTKPAGPLERISAQPHLVLSNNDDLSATLLPRESVAFRFPFWHRRSGRQGPLPVRMRV